jgi:hypothetical protein
VLALRGHVAMVHEGCDALPGGFGALRSARSHPFVWQSAAVIGR